MKVLMAEMWREVSDKVRKNGRLWTIAKLLKYFHKNHSNEGYMWDIIGDSKRAFRGVPPNWEQSLEKLEKYLQWVKVLLWGQMGREGSFFSNKWIIITGMNVSCEGLCDWSQVAYVLGGGSGWLPRSWSCRLGK